MEIRENAGYKESAAGYKENRQQPCPYAKNVAAVIIRECPMNNSCRKNRPMCAKTLGITVKSCRSSEWKIRIITEIKVHAVFDVERRGKHANGGRRTAGNGHAKAAPGGVISGVYKAGTHEVINIDSCGNRG